MKRWDMSNISVKCRDKEIHMADSGVKGRDNVIGHPRCAFSVLSVPSSLTNFFFWSPCLRFSTFLWLVGSELQTHSCFVMLG